MCIRDRQLCLYISFEEYIWKIQTLPLHFGTKKKSPRSFIFFFLQLYKAFWFWVNLNKVYNYTAILIFLNGTFAAHSHIYLSLTANYYCDLYSPIFPATSIYILIYWLINSLIVALIVQRRNVWFSENSTTVYSRLSRPRERTDRSTTIQNNYSYYYYRSQIRPETKLAFPNIWRVSFDFPKFHYISCASVSSGYIAKTG